MINLDLITKIPSKYNCTLFIRPDPFEMRTGTFCIVAECNETKKEIGGIIVDAYCQKEAEAFFKRLEELCEKNFKSTDLAKRMGLDGSIA